MDEPVRGSGRCRSMKSFDHIHECGLLATEVFLAWFVICTYHHCFEPADPEH
jgi:hypothetical protein